MTHTYESNDDVIPVKKMTALEELQDAASMLEHTRGDLDVARERHHKAVARWNEACNAAAQWIEAHSPESQNGQNTAKAAY